ncbi:MAG: DUF2339 domain-containing protein, partial [Deltaproteobacteria bacterium]|nr:DUF2339 domain-containing protein [Deltaproteobacteria bacterium]
VSEAAAPAVAAESSGVAETAAVTVAEPVGTAIDAATADAPGVATESAALGTTDAAAASTDAAVAAAPVAAAASLAATEAIATSEPASTGAPPIAPPPPAPPSSAPPSSPPPSSDEGWERWIGVRGAAALGACVLVVAALYFFQFSIEHGWIGPFARVCIGLAAGMACVVGSEPLRRRYEGTTIAATLANWLAGAGIAILYASSWAASGLYQLVPSIVSGVAMVAITGACAGLAVYRDSLAIAVLGLFGGFLTPLALSTGQDRPIPLFTYLFLLDAALLFLAQRKRWPSLAALALAFTALYQLAWIFGSMREATTWIGLIITLFFSALFAGATMLVSHGDTEDEKENATNKLVRIAAVLVPFVLAIAFATQGGGVVGFGTTLTLVCLLSIGAIFVARRDRIGWLAPAAASATVGLVLVFLASHASHELVAWQVALMTIVPAFVYLAGVELSEREIWLLPEDRSLAIASLIVSGGATMLLGLFASLHAEAFVTWTITLVLLSLALLRVTHLTGWSFVALLSSLVHGGTWAVWSFAWADRDEPVRLAVVAVLGVLHLAFYQGLAVLSTRESEAASLPEGEATGMEGLVSRRTLLEAAASIGPALLLLSLVAADALRDLHLVLHVALAWVLGLFVAMPAMRSANRAMPYLGVLPLVASALVALVMSANEISLAPLRQIETARTIRFASSAVAVVLFTVLPTLSRGLARTRWAWRAAAITPLLFFGALHHGWTWAFGTQWIGALPVSLALLTLSLVGLARTQNDDDREVRVSALVWLSGATMLFVTVAIPLQLDREWITIGWALEAVALLALYRRLDHAGLKWVAMLLFVSVSARLLLNPYVLGYYERSPIRIFNWLSYTYLVPAACLVAGGMLLAELEGPRLRTWESTFLPDATKRPFTALFYGLALVIGFAWLNLTIFDWYATGPALSIPTDRLPARDLTISIAWALYGLFMLALGMWRSSTPMRITSLLLILLTAAKVFLYDLSNLRDLYRVAALVGLAMSLIIISLAYQRFVFRSTPKERA